MIFPLAGDITHIGTDTEQYLCVMCLGFDLNANRLASTYSLGTLCYDVVIKKKRVLADI